jgi:hypothetical protein
MTMSLLSSVLASPLIISWALPAPASMCSAPLMLCRWPRRKSGNTASGDGSWTTLAAEDT